jgi:hypothetical protein
VRNVVFERAAQTITVHDTISAPGALVVTTHWLTATDPRHLGAVLDHGAAEVVIRELPLTDPGLSASWGTDRLWRVSATVRGENHVTTCLTIRG